MKKPTLKTFLLQDDGTFPNHPRWPLLVYDDVLELSEKDAASSVERVFRENGWSGLWRDGIYSFAHYHSNAHEVLGVFSGHARVQFGGPKGVELELHAGHVAVLPAGTVHQNLGSSPDFGVVGAYPPGMDDFDLCRGNQQEHSRAIENIKQVPRPETDPCFGNQGGLREHWRP